MEKHNETLSNIDQKKHRLLSDCSETTTKEADHTRLVDYLSKRTFEFQAVFQILQGIFFAGSIEIFFNSALIHQSDPSDVWMILSLCPLMMWPLFISFYIGLCRTSSKNWKTSLFYYVASSFTLGMIILQYTFVVTFYMYEIKKEGLTDPSPYLWYSAFISGALLLSLSRLNLYSKYEASIFQVIKFTVKFILIVTFVTLIMPFSVVNLRALDVRILMGVVSANFIGIGLIIRGNERNIQKMVARCLETSMVYQNNKTKVVEFGEEEFLMLYLDNYKTIGMVGVVKSARAIENKA